MIWITGTIFLFLYIAITCKKEICFFKDKLFLSRWMKSSGYYFYKKVVSRYSRCPGDLTEDKNYKKMQQIYFKQDISSEWIEFQGKRYALLLAGILSVCIVGSLSSFFLSQGKLIEEYELVRPEYGSSGEEFLFKAEDEDGNQEEIRLTLEAQIYTEEETQEIFEEYFKVLKQKVKGENKSLQEVRTALDFEPDSEWKGVDISWKPSDYEIITENGDVLLENAQEGNTAISLYLSMTHAQYSKTFEVPVTVVKYQSDSSDESLQSYLTKVQSENQEEAIFKLPATFAGKKIRYISESDHSVVVGIILLIITVIVLLLYKQQAEIKEQGIKRELQMKADYPEIITKLLILIRAGMPIKSAWIRIVEDYQKQKKQGGKIHFALEEMNLAIKDMQNGMNEGEAYLKFGKRCEQHLYLKLGTLLEQNLKKGNSGISVLLENERIQALEERRRQVRAAGELAGTKLMMPMILLFALVLIIIIVPSFMTFGM